MDSTLLLLVSILAIVPLFFFEWKEVLLVFCALVVIVLLQAALTIILYFINFDDFINPKTIAIIIFCVIPSITEEPFKFLIIQKANNRFMFILMAWSIVLFEYLAFSAASALSLNSDDALDALTTAKFHSDQILIRGPSILFHFLSCFMYFLTLTKGYTVKCAVLLAAVISHTLFNFYSIQLMP